MRAEDAHEHDASSASRRRWVAQDLGCRGDAERSRLLGKVLLQPPVGDLDAGRKPYALMTFHVFDHFFERAGPAQPAGYVRVQLKRGKHRPKSRFFIKIVEEPFPQTERIFGMIAGTVLMAVEPAVAKGLAWKLDQTGLAVFPNEGVIVSEGVAIPDVALLHQQFDGVVALSTGAPAHRPLAGSLQKHVGGAPDAFQLLFTREIPREQEQ